MGGGPRRQQLQRRRAGSSPRASAGGLAAFKAFTADLVKRYGPNGTFWAANPSLPEKPIRAWQIWNEQNSPSFYGPKPNVKAYAKLLDAANKAISSVDPKAEVILGGMFGTPQQGRKPSIFAWNFLDKLYTIKGAKKDFDGVGIHPYAGQMTKVIQQTELMIESIRDARDRTATTWITELGWASSGPANPLVKGSKGQAQRLKDAFNYFLKNRRKFKTQTVIWYSWRDHDGEGLCEWCAGSGPAHRERRREALLQRLHPVHRRQLSAGTRATASLLALLAATLAAGGCGTDEADVPDVPPSFYGVTPQGPVAEADFERMAEGGSGRSGSCCRGTSSIRRRSPVTSTSPRSTR